MQMILFLFLTLWCVALGSDTGEGCPSFSDCTTCLSHNCAWCLSSKTCRNDEPWMCQGDVDHVGKLGKRQTCPSQEELKADRESRRRLEASMGGGGAGAEESARVSPDGEASASSAPFTTNSGGKKEAWDSSSPSHIADLVRRAAAAGGATAASGVSGVAGERASNGAQHPYETLGVPTTASPREIRKAFLTLSTRLHPDRNLPEHAKAAEAAFADMSAAYDLLSDQQKREAFDAEAAGGAAFFQNEAEASASGRDFSKNLYPSTGLVSELTEATFPHRVSGDHIFLIQFYAPWCGHCQAAVPIFKSVSEVLSGEEDSVDVGAINCIQWPSLCAKFDIRAYPTVKLVSGRGMIQDSTGVNLEHPETLATWARDTAREWRWLYAASGTVDLVGEKAFRRGVLRSPQFWVVLFLDGAHCGPCRTARTNLMRLGASAGPGRVRTGVVDCEREEEEEKGTGGVCKALGLPSPPHAPMLRAFRAGNKTLGEVGEALFDPTAMEPHVALALVDAVLRLAVVVEGEGEGAVSPPGGAGKPKWRKEGEEEEEGKEGSDDSPPPPPPRPKWNGPPPRPISSSQGGGGGWGGGGGFAQPQQRLG